MLPAANSPALAFKKDHRGEYVMRTGAIVAIAIVVAAVFVFVIAGMGAAAGHERSRPSTTTRGCPSRRNLPDLGRS
jgi:hypothetical protein